ncbi:hypothetical protein F2Q69_00051972 [Brassica cretica]|uniref:Uncharacterized protein n=1 Tax=Brassica cretica TaxID=69181 RepID=A0A8S9N636_BRACR|nr:hypothetical protein F2Q69_00051972 [Brassica cretica]
MSAPSSEWSDWSLISRSMRSISSPSLLPVGGGSSIARSFKIKSSTAAGSCGSARGFAPGLRPEANISFIWSSIAVSAVTVDTFPAGVLSALASAGVPSCVCGSLSALVVISD